MKKTASLFIVLLLFLMVGCTKYKKLNFDVPKEDITILKDPYDCASTGVTYKPLIISDDTNKKRLIDNLNSWRLVVDRREHKDSCVLFEIKWEDHNIGIYGGVNITGFVIDKESYDLVKGNVDFLNDYEFEQ